MEFAPTDARPALAITPAALLAAGYRKYDQHDMDRYKRHLYQKRVRNENEYTLYFIGFTEWTFPDHDSMSVDVVLYGFPHTTMRLSLTVENDTTLAEVEAFYADAHTRLGCGADRDNQ